MRDIKASYSDSSFYDGWLKEDDGRRRMWAKRVSRIQPWLKGSEKILDFSAGIGTFLGMMKDAGFDVYGTELSTSAIRIAKQKYGITLHDESFFRVPEYRGYFDIITAWHVVEHVESPSALLGQCHEWLKPSGRVVVAVPNVEARHLRSNWLRSDPQKLFPPLVPGDEIHLSHFSTDTITRLLNKIGFRVLEMGIDDHFAVRSLKNRLQYLLFNAIHTVTHRNVGATIFVVAEKV